MFLLTLKSSQRIHWNLCKSKVERVTVVTNTIATKYNSHYIKCTFWDPIRWKDKRSLIMFAMVINGWLPFI